MNSIGWHQLLLTCNVLSTFPSRYYVNVFTNYRIKYIRVICMPVIIQRPIHRTVYHATCIQIRPAPHIRTRMPGLHMYGILPVHRRAHTPPIYNRLYAVNNKSLLFCRCTLFSAWAKLNEFLTWLLVKNIVNLYTQSDFSVFGGSKSQNGIFNEKRVKSLTKSCYCSARNDLIRSDKEIIINDVFDWK